MDNKTEADEYVSVANIAHALNKGLKKIIIVENQLSDIETAFLVGAGLSCFYQMNDKTGKTITIIAKDKKSFFDEMRVHNALFDPEIIEVDITGSASSQST